MAEASRVSLVSETQSRDLSGRLGELCAGQQRLRAQTALMPMHSLRFRRHVPEGSARPPHATRRPNPAVAEESATAGSQARRLVGSHGSGSNERSGYARP
jgi:hypothetical protein